MSQSGLSRLLISSEEDFCGKVESKPMVDVV
uniref:Uncharacterized protein n=1 Tax=Arundo donax TaxID=35708 RepID=A0A0A8ZUF9_ARUDO